MQSETKSTTAKDKINFEQFHELYKIIMFEGWQLKVSECCCFRKTLNILIPLAMPCTIHCVILPFSVRSGVSLNHQGVNLYSFIIFDTDFFCGFELDCMFNSPGHLNMTCHARAPLQPSGVMLASMQGMFSSIFNQ